MKVLTFGNFNLVHAGHIDHFRLMRTLVGDTGEVIVAIAADKVTDAARQGWTVFSLWEKMAIISSCQYVDTIDVYGQEIPEETLAQEMSYAAHLELMHDTENRCVDLHQPDILAFGDDKPLESYDHIRYPVKRVAIPRLRGGISSLEIIQKIRGFQTAPPTLPDNYDRTV